MKNLIIYVIKKQLLIAFILIFINAGERHTSAHVHIKSLSKEVIRINLHSLIQMKGDKVKYEKLFDLKERKKFRFFKRK